MYNIKTNYRKFSISRNNKLSKGTFNGVDTEVQKEDEQQLLPMSSTSSNISYNTVAFLSVQPTKSIDTNDSIRKDCHLLVAMLEPKAL